MTRRALLFTAVVAGAALTAGLAAQTGRPMTIDDLLAAVRVGDPQLSPDGRTVLYVRTTTDLATGRRNADIHFATTERGDTIPRPGGVLIGDPARSENTPRWFPDGRQIAFISNRDGDPQVYVATANGSGIRRITDVSGGVQPPLVVSPDGAWVAFVADVYPECADDACNRAKRAAAEKDPVKVRVLTRLLFRHWDEWRENVRHHVFVAPTLVSTPLTPVEATARDLTPGDFDSPPGQQEDAAIAFTPDSRSVAFVSNRDGNDTEAWSTNSDVWLVPVAGGRAAKLTSNPAADAQPVFTPDGRTLVVRAQRRPGFESDRWYLDVYDRATGAKRTVFTAPDLSANEFTIGRDGQTIYFTASNQGTDDLFRVPMAGGAPVLVEKGGAVSAVGAGANLLVFSRASMTAPAEIYTMSITGEGQKEYPSGQPRTDAMDPLTGRPRVDRLTSENAAWLKAVAMNRPESRTVPGAGGTPIQYWLVRPPAFDPAKKHPVVFLIHGGPQGAWGDAWSARWNPTLWAAQGWVVAAPNPRGSTGFGQRFVDEISQDWGGKVMADLAAVFDDVVKLPYVDASRQAVAGASYGGYAVNWLIGHTNRFKAAVSHDGVFNLESMALATEELWFTEWEAGGTPWSPAGREHVAKWSPHLYAAQMKTPTLVITNELDFRVPVDQGLQLFTALRRNGVPAKALVFPDEGHWVLKAPNSRRWHEEVFGWIREHLK
jgi:dipeptidyl aminopeptidase/acylaminoacyl peptidase